MSMTPYLKNNDSNDNRESGNPLSLGEEMNGRKKERENKKETKTQRGKRQLFVEIDEVETHLILCRRSWGDRLLLT